LAGIGVTSTRLSDGTSDTSKTAVGFGGGGGLQYAMSSANLFLEIRYLSTKAFDLTFAQVPITVGVSFPLGGKK
jgi:opacity protein-like surface antigen